MKTVKGSIEIDAPGKDVWGVVTDFVSYPQWNPFLTKSEGEAKLGGEFKVTVKPDGRKELSFKTKVLRYDANGELITTGSVKPGFTSTHLFKVESLGANKARFSQSITFKGPLTYFVGGSIRDTQTALDHMNDSLKQRCEQSSKS